MNIDDVLLTEKEWQTSRHDTCKAQALKLLEWLEKPCKEHYIAMRESYDVPRLDCPKCMSELEAILKEG
jgi:hypothetical protein